MKTNDELQKDVMGELKWDPQLKNIAANIGVAANDGVVTLLGLVDTYSKKIATERITQSLQGVKVVAVDIEVKPGGSGSKTDTEIAEAMRNALCWNSAVNEDKIEVAVDNGWVYLRGTAEWNFEKRSAQSSAEVLLGVRGVTNTIEIKSNTIDVKDIKGKIASAFQRSAALDSSSIKIDTLGSKVTLRGTVRRSWAEKEGAERIAWSSPCVFSVDNQIKINTEVFA